MSICCPPGAGCNARGSQQPCALDVFAVRTDADAQRALALWSILSQARRSASRRFAQRAYTRARDRALARGALAGIPAAAVRLRPVAGGSGTAVRARAGQKS
ncbi:MAG TPA: hypothetical protein VHX88_21600 [Solirubrobacteraceae bacterium]|jgi:hypothetical protein|nr:hypothetical protein [Solirubrobacteraceae bacterium]